MIYDEETLREQFEVYREYAQKRLKVNQTHKVRLPSFTEDVSENIIKFLIRNKLGDKTCKWECETGDLVSDLLGKIECKCFTSNGPLSFSPTSDWDVIFFLDATSHFKDNFILYRINLKKTSDIWKSIPVNKSQCFNDQCEEKRRPRITWKQIYSKIPEYCQKIYEGDFEGIFTAIGE
jgi:hypothetical protein